MEVKNPFKPDEDPFGLSKKRILSKENIQFCNVIYRKGLRLKILDDNGKIDRQKAKQLHYRLYRHATYSDDTDVEFQAVSLLREAEKLDKNKFHSELEHFIFNSRHQLDADEVYKFTNDKFK